MNGTATTCSSATASGCSAHTSSTTAATRRWGPPGATSTSRRSAVRRLGRTRQRVTPRPRRTSGGTGTTTTTPRPRLIRSGSRCPTLEKPPSESATQRLNSARSGHGSDEANAGVDLIDNEHIAEAVRGHSCREIEGGLSGRSTVAAEPLHAVAGQGDDDASRHASDTHVGAVHEDKIAGSVHDHSGRAIQPGTGGHSAVPAEALRPVACHGGDDAGGAHAADAVVVEVAEEHVTEVVHRHAEREVQAGAGGRTAVPTKARNAVACRRGHDAGGRFPAGCACVSTIGDEEIAGAVHLDANRIVQDDAAGRTVPAETRHAVAPRGGDDAPHRVHPAAAG